MWVVQFDFCLVQSLHHHTPTDKGLNAALFTFLEKNECNIFLTLIREKFFFF